MRPAGKARSTPGRWDEAYVDYVVGQPNAGIINDPAVLGRITPEGIAELNERGGETNVSTGWHAIEFLLWGQDLDPDGPGARPVSDYTTCSTRSPKPRSWRMPIRRTPTATASPDAPTASRIWRRAG